MKKLFLALMLLCAAPCYAQLVLPSGTGVVQAPVDANGWLSYKLVLTQSVTSFSFVVIPNGTPPPSQAIRTVEFVENNVGGFTVTFAANISNPCSISTGANSITICQFIFDSTSSTWAGLNVGGVPGSSPLPAASSGPGPVFNVKNYGAKGDTQWVFTGGGQGTNGTTTVTCTPCNFTTADIGKSIYVHTQQGGSEQFNTATTITGINSGTSVTVSNAAAGNLTNAVIVWGHLDDNAIISGPNPALTPFLAAIFSQSQTGTTGVAAAAPTLYFPAGNYLLCTSLAANGIKIPASNSRSGFAVIGDGPDQTRITSGSGSSCPLANNNAGVVFFTAVPNGIVRGITFDGASNAGTASVPMVSDGSGSSTHWYDVIIQNWNLAQNAGALFSQGVTFLNRVQVEGNSAGFTCSACNGEAYESVFSNNASNTNLQFSNVRGLQNGVGYRIVNSLVDECGSLSTGCTQVSNSQDIWFQGLSAFGTNSGRCLDVDGTSFVHWSGGICGTFGNDTNNSGVKIETGGVLQSSDVRYVGTGTGNCIINSGIFNDNGGNSCESMFVIASGTSTGTAAVLTLTTAGANVNTNCSVNDALMVQGASIAGYNGYFAAPSITAVTATTLSYTTVGSNLGALGAGGVAMCRNLQSYSGTLPRALLNNPIPNTCYLTITPITNATTFNLCNWGAGQATNITRITASSQVVTTCATAPIITISNGTVSQTLTLTSGKQFWDSFNAQDVSTGVGTTIFKPSISLTGADRITLKYDAGALSSCTTPPTNLGVTYTIAPILSN